MTERIDKLRDNLTAIQSRIADAATNAGRDPHSVTLVAVTKYVDEPTTRDLVNAGCLDCGENRPQAFWAKAESMADMPVRWHQIGHLQRNKLKRTLPASYLIHSVDSLRLLSAINETQSHIDPAEKKSILLEVNISGDQAKDGFTTDEIKEAVELAISLNCVRLRGLMGMAGLGTSPDEARRDFASLKTVHQQMAEQYPEAGLQELSMGMSGDFEQAIAEGATLVRVGSALFAGVV